MTQFGIFSLAAALFLALCPGAKGAEGSGTPPEFQEVYELIRNHAPGISETELNDAAVRGLILALSPRAQLITDPTATDAASGTLGRVAQFEENIGYLRVTNVASGLASEIRKAHRQFQSSNKLQGIVIDLRYAGGQDYAAAVAAADLFLAKEQPVIDWGVGPVSSTSKTNAIQIPVAILVNSGTSAAAEALAGVLRSTGVGLILGSPTAGHALKSRDFPLKNGSVLRLATGPVTLGTGTAISTNGLKPDIDVTVDPDDERTYYADAFALLRGTNALAAGGTNGIRSGRFGEAELVRQHRAGLRSGDEERSVTDPQPDRPLVNDPALARALDLLKGLAVVRQSRS